MNCTVHVRPTGLLVIYVRSLWTVIIKINRTLSAVIVLSSKLSVSAQYNIRRRKSVRRNKMQKRDLSVPTTSTPAAWGSHGMIHSHNPSTVLLSSVQVLLWDSEFVCTTTAGNIASPAETWPQPYVTHETRGWQVTAGAIWKTPWFKIRSRDCSDSTLIVTFVPNTEQHLE